MIKVEEKTRIKANCSCTYIHLHQPQISNVESAFNSGYMFHMMVDNPS